MGDIEWGSSKYSRSVRKFLKYSEKLAVESGHQLVADSEAIKEYLDLKFGVNSIFILRGQKFAVILIRKN